MNLPRQRRGRARRPVKVVRSKHRPRIEVLEQRQLLSAVDWFATTSGDWNNPNNWSTGQVPGPNDDVVINVSGATPTVTIDSDNQSVHSLTADDPLVLSGGSLSVGSQSTISGPFTFSGGTLTTNAPLTFAGSTQWSSGQINNQDQTLTNTGSITINDAQHVVFGSGSYSSGGTLINQGTIVETGAGGLQLANGAVIDNAAGGTYDFAADSGIALGGFGGSFTNAGTVEKSAGTGTSAIAVPFSNQGSTVAADSGTLSLAGGGSSTGGTYNADSGATIDLGDSQRPTLTGTYTGSGAGAVNVGSDAVNIGQAGATFDFPSGLFQWSSGNIDCATGDTLTNTGSITVNDAQQVQFDSGSSYVGGGTLINQGTIFQTGAGGLEVSEGAVIDNASGGIFDLAGNVGIVPGFNGASLTNSGTVEKTAGTGTASIAIAFDNQGGTVAADSGTLSLAGGGSSTGGTYDPASGATIDLADGSAQPTLTGTYTGSGAGTVNVGGGALAIGQASATFDFPTGLFQWSSGGINCSTGRTLTNTGSITVNDAQPAQFGSGNSYVGGGTLINQGILFQTGSGGLEVSEGAAIDNATGGTYELPGDVGIAAGFNGGSFTNAGTLEKTAGTGTSAIAISFANQGGTVAVQSGALNLVASNTSSTGGAVVVDAGALSLSASSSSFAGVTFAVDAGTLNLSASSSSFAGDTFAGAAPSACRRRAAHSPATRSRAPAPSACRRRAAHSPAIHSRSPPARPWIRPAVTPTRSAAVPSTAPGPWPSAAATSRSASAA